MLRCRLRRPCSLRWLLLPLVVSVALAGCTAGHDDPGSAAQATWSCPSGQPYSGDPNTLGVQFHGAWSDYSDADRARVLDLLASSGVGWVRIDATWSELEPRTQGRWDARALGRLDTAVRMAADRHLQVLVTVLNTPRWAGGGKDGIRFPSSPDTYATAIGFLAARYGDRVAAWEVWNEPDSPDFAAGGDAVGYTALLRAAYPAVKVAAPQALVVFGGLQYNDANFLAKAYTAGAHGFFDVMATHPYPAPSDAPPRGEDDGTPYSLGHVRAVHAVMADSGDGDLPVWFTELGWSTHANTGDEAAYERGVTPRQQADYLLRSLQLVHQDFPYVARVFWYAERDRKQGTAQISHFGLLTTALQPKPALRALSCFVRP